MTKAGKRLAAARNNPRNVRFDDLLSIVIAAGFTHVRTKGSHEIFTHPSIPQPLSLQRGGDGKAKPYQVRQVLETIDDCGLEVS